MPWRYSSSTSLLPTRPFHCSQPWIQFSYKVNAIRSGPVAVGIGSWAARCCQPASYCFSAIISNTSGVIMTALGLCAESRKSPCSRSASARCIIPASTRRSELLTANDAGHCQTKSVGLAAKISGLRLRCEFLEHSPCRESWWDLRGGSPARDTIEPDQMSCSPFSDPTFSGREHGSRAHFGICRLFRQQWPAHRGHPRPASRKFGYTVFGPAEYWMDDLAGLP
jgi:hypothetical protein